MAKKRVFHYVVSVVESRLGDFQELILLGEFPYQMHQITENGEDTPPQVKPKPKRKSSSRFSTRTKIKLLFREHNEQCGISSQAYKLWQILKKKYKNGDIVTQGDLSKTARVNKMDPSVINSLDKHFKMIQRLPVSEE